MLAALRSKLSGAPIPAGARRIMSPCHCRAAALRWLQGLLCLGLLAGSLESIAPPRTGLTEAPRLRATYDLVLAADLDRVGPTLRTTCPPAPSEACQALDVVAAWWRIQQDPDSRALDVAFQERARAAIGAAGAWTRREPERAEAWFYLAGALAPLVQWRVLRGERMAAALDGKRIKDALERALTLDPGLTDAHFGIGLYHYYAAVAPAAAKMLRWLLLLPGGDRETGLREMRETRDRGELLRGEADYQLHWLYLWYENRPRDALALLEGLSARYPSNPIFLQRRAEVVSEYFHDHPGSAQLWEALLTRATRGSVHHAEMAEARARLGLASELDEMYETDRAVDQLKAVTAAPPTAPYSIAARAYVQLGEAFDRLGKRDDAVAAYRAALSRIPPDDALRLRARARGGLRRPPGPRSPAYALSLEGWRALEGGNAARALDLLAQASRLPGADEAVRVRHALAMKAVGDNAGARQALEAAISARIAVPQVMRATAFVEYAALLDANGERSRAIDYYKYTLDAVGGDPRAYERARIALAMMRR